MNFDERIPLIVGDLRLIVRDGKKRVVRDWSRKNTIQNGVLYGVPYALGADNTAGAFIYPAGLDFYSSESSEWMAGSVISMAAGGAFTETYVTHTASYTAAATRTIKQIRLRRNPTAFTTSDLTSVNMLSQVTNLTVQLKSGWSIEAEWKLYIA